MKKVKPLSGFYKRTRLFNSVIIAIILVMTLPSCVTPKNSYYFKNLPRDTTLQSFTNKSIESRIRKNDLLSINFSSLNPEEDLKYNAPSSGGISAAGAGASSSANGYQVDAAGNIQLHKLGILHVEGMTRRQLKEKIQTDIEPYLKDPVIMVRYLNHKITVLGEVSKPTIIQMPEEYLSLFDVLSSSGDLTQFAKRDNILIIRETSKGKELKRINLEDHSIFSSEWYYLQPDDVVYVEPSDKKLNEEKRNQKMQTVGLALSGVSILVILLDRIFR